MAKTLEEKRAYQRDYQRRKRAEQTASIERLFEGLRLMRDDEVHLNDILDVQHDFLDRRGSEVKEALKTAKQPNATQQDIQNAIEIGRRYEEDYEALEATKNSDPIVMRAHGRLLLRFYREEQFIEFPEKYRDMAENATFTKSNQDEVMMMKLLFGHLKWQDPLFHEYDY